MHRVRVFDTQTGLEVSDKADIDSGTCWQAPEEYDITNHNVENDVPHTIDQCTVCTAVVDQVRRHLTADEWAGTVQHDKWATKKFMISELRAMDAVQNICHSILCIEEGSPPGWCFKKGGWTQRYALVVLKGIGRFLPSTHAHNGTVRVFYLDGVKWGGVQQPATSLVKLVSLCEAMREEHEDSMIRAVMEGKAARLRMRLCVKKMGVCTNEGISFLTKHNMIDTLSSLHNWVQQAGPG